MDVTVFTQNGCPPCKVVKMFLNEHQIPFAEKNITKDAKARDELIHVYGAYSTPTVIVEGEAVVGFDLVQLSRKLNIPHE